MSRLTLILCLHRILRDGIEQSRAIHTDGRLQAHFIVDGTGIRVEGHLVDGDLGIDELQWSAVGKLRGIDARWRCGYGFPLDMDAALVDGGLERIHGLGLGHTGDLAHVAVGGIFHAVGVCTGCGVIDNEQITIAHFISPVFVLSFSVPITRMTVFATRAHPGGAQSTEGSGEESVVVLEEGFAVLERLIEVGIVGHLWHGVGVASLLIGGGSFLATGIPLCGREVAHGLSYVLVLVGDDDVVVVVTGGDRHGGQSYIYR